MPHEHLESLMYPPTLPRSPIFRTFGPGVKIYILFGKCSIGAWAGIAANVTEVCLTEMIHRLGHGHLLQNPSQFIIHPSCCIAYIVTAS